VSQTESDGHLPAHRIAAWADGTLAREERATIEAHLATCADCRAEAADVSRIVRSLPMARTVGRRTWIPAAAAAALALLWVGSRPLREPGLEQHREEAVTTTVAPRPIAPIDTVDRVTALVWSSVPGADRYRVRFFDAEGTVIWEGEDADTVAALPDSLALRAGRPYYWRVEAHTGFDRWVASDLIELVARRGGTP
jgi:anti-sigma factor RsiW